MNLTKVAWSEEYKKKGIPSSFRTDPARVVVEFMTWFQAQGRVIEGVAADIGCGRGRNSFYLASQGFRVIGLELLEENVSWIHQRAAECHAPVQAFAQDVASSWPIPVASLTLAIDIFCYKHVVDKKQQAKYRLELKKSLKPGGLYFISLASEHDGFYGPLLKHSSSPHEKLILDPYSNIPSFLYSKEDLEREFSDCFDIISITEQESISPMYGKEYPRVVLNAVFQVKT